MFRKTPPFYFDGDNFKLEDDPILEFYRPFADILQDTFDEQTFLNGINHIDKIPAQLIPYLAFLIGWDLPNYPGATDTVRRSILRQAVRLQKLKGTKRAIIELFEIFGFTIDLINLWYSSDGQQLIAPGERLPSQIQKDEIFTEDVIQAEPMLSDYSTSGFGDLDIPLLYRAAGNIVVSAYLVKPGVTKDQLNALVDDAETDPGGTIGPGGSDINSVRDGLMHLDKSTLVSQTDVVIDYTTGLGTLGMSTTTSPLINGSCVAQLTTCRLQPISGVRYDPVTNIVHVVFDHNMDFSDGSSIFVFAEYKRTRILVPPQLENMRSNRFDVKILLRETQQPVPALLDFLLNFVFKLKAFHSLLRKFAFNLDVQDVYNVTDFCLGTSDAKCGVEAESAPQPATAPPPTPATCEEEEITPAAQQMRDAIFNGLQTEFQTWRDCFDGTHKSDPALEHFVNLPIQKPEGDTCQFTQYGQNRVYPSTVNTDLNPDDRKKLCQDTSVYPALCFPGRVKADLQMLVNGFLCEVVHCKPCAIGFGTGFYWVYPTDAIIVQENGFGHFTGQDSVSFLGHKIKQYNHPIPWALHFTNRPFFIPEQFQSNQLLAYRRPSLEIYKDNLFFPSHRYVSMANLKNDFTHPTWKAKPYDYVDNNLHARLITGPTGDDQHLVYDDVPLVYYGNGIEADISSFGAHDDRPFLVTHKVYLTGKPSHPAIKLSDMVTETTQEEITLDSSVPFGPIFKSYNQACNQDFRGGYPSETGRFNVDIDAIDFDNGRTEAWGEMMGLPYRGASEDATSATTALFTFGSGILVHPEEAQYRYYEPYRLDCDCLRYACGDSFGSFHEGDIADVRLNIDPCILNRYKQKDGTYDYNCDQLEMQQKMVLREQVGVCSTTLDGTIPNMLCIISNGIAPSQILPEGAFRFKDDYDQIYEGTWLFDGKKLDIVYMTKQPYVWGEPRTGFMRGRLVFRKGIITLIHQVFYLNNGVFVEYSKQSEQRVDYFQTNLQCGDQPFVDNFCYHLDCCVTDDFVGLVTCGTRWVDPSDNQVVWPDLVIDSYGMVSGIQINPGLQPFMFMDIWDNDETLVTVCPSVSSGSV
jgi:phage tail P2-like protein